MPAPSPTDRTEVLFLFDLDVLIEGNGKGIESRAEIGRRCWGTCSHDVRVLVTRASGRDQPGRAVRDSLGESPTGESGATTIAVQEESRIGGAAPTRAGFRVHRRPSPPAHRSALRKAP